MQAAKGSAISNPVYCSRSGDAYCRGPGEGRKLEADHQYFARRAEEERRAAEAAATPEEKSELLALADRFARLAEALEKHRIRDLD